jgi:ribosomal protein S18 acetylase RimI-like enzyme
MASNDPTLTISEVTPRSWWQVTNQLDTVKGQSSRSGGLELQTSNAIWLVGRRDSQVVGTCRGELAPGQTAAVFPPTLAESELPTTGRILLNALEEKLSGKGEPVRFLHALTGLDQYVEREVLKAAGFQALGEVLHMTCRVETIGRSEESRLEFEAFVDNPTSWNRLANVFEQTCQGTSDFPELNCLQSATQSLDGYRDVGRFHPELWQFVKLEGNDVGCLLLNELDQPDVCQVVYCGLIPSVRLCGLGKELARRCKQIAGTHSAKRVVLSVDKRNHAAIRAYESAGFRVTDQQMLFFKDITKEA